MNIAIVGNAPPRKNLSSVIDTHDIVIRFNNAVAVDGYNGSKTTVIALVNHGDQPREWIHSSEFLIRPEIANASRAVFPFQRRDALTECHSHQLQTKLGKIGLRSAHLPPWSERDLKTLLARFGAAKNAPPSTGALLIYWAVMSLKGRSQTHSVNVTGFEFEGWCGHDWAAEALWFENFLEYGQVKLL